MQEVGEILFSADFKSVEQGARCFPNKNEQDDHGYYFSIVTRAPDHDQSTMIRKVNKRDQEEGAGDESIFMKDTSKEQSKYKVLLKNDEIS